MYTSRKPCGGVRPLGKLASQVRVSRKLELWAVVPRTIAAGRERAVSYLHLLCRKIGQIASGAGGLRLVVVSLVKFSESR